MPNIHTFQREAVIPENSASSRNPNSRMTSTKPEVRDSNKTAGREGRIQTRGTNKKE